MINPDGSQLQRITYEPSDEREPVFSKDGKRIVFASTRQNPSGNRDLWSVALDGSQVLRLTETPEDEMHPAFSPDGTQLAWWKGYPNAGLMVGNAFAARPKLVKAGSVSSHTWSHDGKFIAYGLHDYDVKTQTGLAWIEKLELWSGKPPVAVSKPGVRAQSPSWAY
jgi:Tol biopolymer transport system component